MGIIRFVAMVAPLMMGHPFLAAAAETDAISTKRLNVAMDELRPLHEKIHDPGPRDWLANHDEPGQTFAQYIRSRPVTPQGKRNVLYIQPIGEFSPAQRKIVTLTAEYVERFFSLDVRTNKSLARKGVEFRFRPGLHPEARRRLPQQHPCRRPEEANAYGAAPPVVDTAAIE